jgi:two-component system, chemotaxis family, CheB/CheR fusion protein
MPRRTGSASFSSSAARRPRSPDGLPESLGDGVGDTIQNLMTGTDLEARTRALEQLADSLERQRSASEQARQKLAAILEALVDPVVVVDDALNEVLTNEAYRRLFGPGGQLTFETEDGAPLAPDATPQARAAAGERFTMQFVGVSADGTRRWFEANAQPVAGFDGSAGVVVVRDITERSLRRLQEQFMAIASHELRTPLTALHGYLQMLSRLIAGTGELPERYVMRALSQSRRLRNLIDELIDLTRLEGGRLRLAPESVDLAALARQSVEIVQSLSDRQELRLRVDVEPLQVTADPSRLEQVIVNLLANAIKHAPESPHVDIRVGRRGRHALLAVRDYGPGIPASDLPQLFSRFFRGTGARSADGLGLGLYISNEIARAHGGSLRARSSEGEGSTFTLRLPLAQPAG